MRRLTSAATVNGHGTALAVCAVRTYLYGHMQRLVNLEETPGKVVGRRRVPADGLAISGANRIEDARAWKRALRTMPIPKGVYRFRTHAEADEWLWQMLTRGRR